mgnify:FL=1
MPGTDVCFDRAEAVRESVLYLGSRGKKRLLYLRTAPHAEADMEGLRMAVEEQNFEDVQIEQLAMHEENHYQEAVAYEHVCALAEKWGKSEKMPDAILVSDDIAMRGIALALVRHRIKTPKDLEVLVFANEGITHHYGIPVTKYEVSPRQFARTLFNALCARMNETASPDLPCKIKGRIIPEPAVRASGQKAARLTPGRD